MNENQVLSSKTFNTDDILVNDDILGDFRIILPLPSFWWLCLSIIDFSLKSSLMIYYINRRFKW